MASDLAVFILMRLCECVNMSKVVAGRLLCADNGLDDPDLFSISHLHDMLEDLKKHYYAAWDGKRPPE